MGLSCFVFPTAEHSRFAHALGAFAVAQRVASRLLEQKRHFPSSVSPPYELTGEEMNVFAIAALCHDLGHTAFSHALEDASLLPDGLLSHDECTLQIIRQSKTLRKKIDAHCDVEAVEQVYQKTHPIKALSQLISSMYDVDKCDYLLRDSHNVGVQYGIYDLEWLLHLMSVSEPDNTLVFDGKKAIDALRQFLHARRSMYLRIYLHPTIRAAQLQLKAIFLRAHDVGDACEHLVPKELRSAVFGKKRRTLGEFLATTDVTVLQMIQDFAAESKDPTLRSLALSFRERRFYKLVFDSSRVREVHDKEVEHDELESIVSTTTELVARQKRRKIPVERGYQVVRDQIRIPPISTADVYLKFGRKLRFVDELKDWGPDYNFHEFTQSHVVQRIYVVPEAETIALEHLRRMGVAA